MYGRPLGLGEMRGVLLAERVVEVVRRWLAPESGEWFAARPDELNFFYWLTQVYATYQHRS